MAIQKSLNSRGLFTYRYKLPRGKGLFDREKRNLSRPPAPPRLFETLLEMPRFFPFPIFITYLNLMVVDLRAASSAPIFLPIGPQILFHTTQKITHDLLPHFKFVYINEIKIQSTT